jgi:hypothetical protein
VLESPQGVVVEGRYGDRILFHLTDGRVMYVPRIVAGRIETEGIAAGERFELCRCNIKNGRRRSIEWTLKRVDPPTSEALERHESPLERNLRRSIEVINENKATEDQPTEHLKTPTPNPPTSLVSTIAAEHDLSSSPVAANGTNSTEDQSPDPSNQSTAPESATPHLAAPPTPMSAQTPTTPAPLNSNGNGATPAARPNGNSSPALQNGKVESVPITKLEHALKTAISAAYNAEKYGAELGYVVRFDADAIKSMAITVLINMSQAAVRR